MAKSSALIPLAAGAAVVAIAASSSKKKKKKSLGKTRWGVRISNDCQVVDIVDGDLFEKFMLGAFNELVEADASLTLLQMTDALFGDIAPHCSGFPERPESADVAELFTVIARRVAQYMMEDPRVKVKAADLMDAETVAHFTDWYRAWRNYPSADIPAAPKEHVSFASDYSDYTIGPKWYENTVVPFVVAAAKDGTLATAAEDFVKSLGVLVGKFIIPIDELPKDKESVKDFYDKISKAVNTAIAEVGG